VEKDGLESEKRGTYSKISSAKIITTLQCDKKVQAEYLIYYVSYIDNDLMMVIKEMGSPLC
jgi:hypothetical protein